MMKNLLTTKNQIIILISLFLITLLSTCNSCNSKKESSRTKKEIKILQDKVDSLMDKSASRQEIERMLRIEGLRTEKRMIQSTNRSILDVNRQSEIEKEIENLQKPN